MTLKNKIYKNKDWLNDQYWNQEKSIREISKKCEVDWETIRYWMKKYNIPRRSLSDSHKGEKHWRWKGGIIENNGYRYLLKPNHPRANGRYVPEHVLVAEKKLGRSLKDGEYMHHINGNGLDNDPENIFVCKNRSEHKKMHNKYGYETKILYKLGLLKFNKEKKEYYLNKEKIKD